MVAGSRMVAREKLLMYSAVGAAFSVKGPYKDEWFEQNKAAAAWGE